LSRPYSQTLFEKFPAGGFFVSHFFPFLHCLCMDPPQGALFLFFSDISPPFFSFFPSVGLERFKRPECFFFPTPGFPPSPHFLLFFPPFCLAESFLPPHSISPRQRLPYHPLPSPRFPVFFAIFSLSFTFLILSWLICAQRASHLVTFLAYAFGFFFCFCVLSRSSFPGSPLPAQPLDTLPFFHSAFFPMLFAFPGEWALFFFLLHGVPFQEGTLSLSLGNATFYRPVFSSVFFFAVTVFFSFPQGPHVFAGKFGFFVPITEFFFSFRKCISISCSFLLFPFRSLFLFLVHYRFFFFPFICFRLHVPGFATFSMTFLKFISKMAIQGPFQFQVCPHFDGFGFCVELSLCTSSDWYCVLLEEITRSLCSEMAFLFFPPCPFFPPWIFFPPFQLAGRFCSVLPFPPCPCRCDSTTPYIFGLAFDPSPWNLPLTVGICVFFFFVFFFFFPRFSLFF